MYEPESIQKVRWVFILSEMDTMEFVAWGIYTNPLSSFFGRCLIWGVTCCENQAHLTKCRKGSYLHLWHISERKSQKFSVEICHWWIGWPKSKIRMVARPPRGPSLWASGLESRYFWTQASAWLNVPDHVCMYCRVLYIVYIYICPRKHFLLFTLCRHEW